MRLCEGMHEGIPSASNRRTVNGKELVDWSVEVIGCPNHGPVDCWGTMNIYHEEGTSMKVKVITKGGKEWTELVTIEHGNFSYSGSNKFRSM